MAEQNDLVERLKQYDAFLTRSIEGEERIAHQENLAGEFCEREVAAIQKALDYRFVQQELYKLFPEVKPKQD